MAELETPGDGATAYRARRYGVDYKLTVFDGESPDPDEALRSLHRAASRLAVINHPLLPGVYELGQLSGRPYVVTTLVSGRPVADLITGDPLSVPQAMRLVLDVVEPLAAMHRQGLVHRELSAHTLVVPTDGSARMLDAGLGGEISTRTATSANPDNLGYLAPEQSGALARPIDNRTDLYSLGVVLFECLTGTLPFLAADPGALAELQSTQAAPDPRTLAADLPESLAVLVTTLLAREPSDRYQSGEELATDLRLLLGESLPDDDPTDETPPLLGREHELSLINELWDQVRRGRGRGIAVRGATGVGKTRLTDEVARTARRVGAPVLTLACRPDDPEPLAPIRRAIADLLLETAALPAVPRKLLQERIRTAAGSAAPLLAGLTPPLGDLLGHTPLPDADRQYQFATAVSHFVAELARQTGGMVMITDDAHLIDPSTLRMMSHLAADIAGVPLLSIGIFRTDRQGLAPGNPLLPAVRAATDLDLVLEPLDRAGVDGLLLRGLPGIDLESAPAQQLREQSHGNPFMVRENVRSLIQAGTLRPHWGSWLLNEGTPDEPHPSDPLALVRNGIDSLHPETRRVLVAAALTGLEFRPLDIIEISEQTLEETFAALADAAGRGLLELTDDSDYRFRHELIREAVLDGIGADDSAALHRRIAEVLGARLDEGAAGQTAETYAVARHYLLATPSDSTDREFVVCRAAGRLAMRTHSPGQAVPFLNHAAQLRPEDARLLHALGTALHRDGNHPTARRRLEEALTLERDGVHRARILLELTEVHRATRNTSKAVTTLEWGLAELDAALPDGRLLRTLGALRAGLVAALIVITGWGFGTARSRHRECADLRAALHLVGGQLGEANLRQSSVLLHRLYGTRAAVRVGAGTRFSLSCAALGVTAARYGFGRLQRRSLAAAERAANDVGDPQLLAQIAWSAGAADYLSRVDNGERWIQCLADQGQWLDAEQYGDAVSAACWDAAVQGRDDDVQRWAECGRVRRAFGGFAELTSLLTITAIGLTAAGRPAAANAELAQLRETLDQHGGRSLKLDLVLAELYALIEQDHLDEHFDAVAARFFAFNLSQTGMLRQHEPFFVLYAQGRLAQCRATQAAVLQRPMAVPRVSLKDRIQAARIAVQQLAAVAQTPLLEAAHQQCQAELLVLEGHPKQALGLLSRLKPQREDAPLLAFEIAQTMARALIAADYPAEARRQVVSALNLAEDHGWTGRRDRLCAEFGLRALTTGPIPVVAVVPPVLESAAPPPAPAASESGPDPAVLDPQGSDRATDRELELATALRDTLVLMSASTDPVEVLRQLVIAAERVLPDGSVWVIRLAPRVFGGGTGSPAPVLFAELPAPGSVRELVFDPELRALTAAGLPVVGDQDSVAPPQLRRLLADAASWLLVPLISDGGQIGVLVLASPRVQAFAETELAVAGAVVAQGMAAHAKASLIARLRELAGTDELTGVRSMRQVIELATRDLQGARLSARPLAVMVIGVDHLGRINDLHGRATGDDVLRQIAVRMGQVIRDTDLVGRYGDDEFVVVLSQGRDGEIGIGDGGLEVAERLLNIVSRTPVQTRVGPLPVTVTIGLTLMTKDDADIGMLTTRAETALHVAKQSGRNQVSGI
jgi:diguanylate cyclase (GGDEF)-like protein